jgi:hypothetical protein
MLEPPKTIDYYYNKHAAFCIFPDSIPLPRHFNPLLRHFIDHPYHGSFHAPIIISKYINGIGQPNPRRIAMSTGLLLLAAIGVIFGLWFLFFLTSIRYIPNNKVGIVEKRWSVKGSLKEQIIALNGEAGFQPDVLRGGICMVPRFIRRVYLVPLVNIPQGELGCVFARDGRTLEPGQTLGRIVPEGRNFQNVRGFLQGGGG